jgi:hypothetical protein
MKSGKIWMMYCFSHLHAPAAIRRNSHTSRTASRFHFKLLTHRRSPFLISSIICCCNLSRPPAAV